MLLKRTMSNDPVSSALLTVSRALAEAYRLMGHGSGSTTLSAYRKRLFAGTLSTDVTWAISETAASPVGVGPRVT